MSHLTIIYELNRYDIANNNVPFSGKSGDMWRHRTVDLIPDLTLDVRVISDRQQWYQPLNPQTRILILGEAALRAVFPQITTSLSQHRGYVLTYQGHPAIATYSPIDCWVTYLKNTSPNDNAEDDDEDEDSTSDNKDIAPTKRANYLFWSLADFKKLLSLPLFQSHHVRPVLVSSDIAEATATLELAILSPCLKLNLTLDIETRMQDHSIDVIGFRLANKTFTIPIYSATNTLAHKPWQLAKFWRALYRAFRSPHITVVGHNLAFDLTILHFLWRLPFPADIYDTMLAMHREIPLIEKSLSHAISYYTTSPRNHKGDICPNTSADNLSRLLAYNAEDLYWTEQVALSQQTKQPPHVRQSVTAAHDIQRLTFLMSATGIRIDEEKLEAAKQLELAKAEQLARVIRILTDNPTFNPNSSQQKARYFYNQLHYPVKTFTKTGAPAAGANALYELALAQHNPLIPLIIAAVEAGKAASMMEFRKRESKI